MKSYPESRGNGRVEVAGPQVFRFEKFVSNPLFRNRKVERATGFEPVTTSLED